MHLPGNVFAITLFLSGIINLWICWGVFRKLNGAVRWFGFIMLGIAVWAIPYALELSADQLGDMLFFANLEYIGIAFLPVLWIIFVFKFIGKDRRLTRGGIILLCLEPALTLAFKWSGVAHLMYVHTEVDYSCPFPMLVIKPGYWYYVHTVFFYALLAWGIALILTRFKNAAGIYKRQNAIILLGAILPWLINLIYLLNVRPFKHLDLTPFAFIGTSLIIGIGFLRFKLFDLVPVAREKIIEALQEGILVVDIHDRLIDVNPEMSKILGKTKNELVGKYLSELFTDIEQLDMLDHQDGGHTEIQMKVNGALKNYLVTISPLFEKSTVYSGNILLFKDITERKQDEEKLKELNQLKDRLFSIIAHDLRSPLLSLMDILNMADEGMVSDEEFRLFLPNLAKNIGYTSGLVENLLIWSKSQLAGMSANPVNFDIQQSTAYVSGLFQHMAAEKGISLLNEIPAGTFVFADQDMIQAVIRNLVANAIKFCQNGDQVTIGASQGAQFVTVGVRDTGIGISAANQAKLFGLQTFTTRGTTNEQGTGLGLVLCKDFIEKNNGTIWVESTPGNGSCFYFTLPFALSSSSSYPA
jgi:PAS domain S-box-containing protein